MGIFDDVVLNAKTAASVVGKKAEQIVDLSKLRYAAAGLNNEISKKKEELGHFIYESAKNDQLDHDVVTRMINEIKDLEENLISTKELIAETKNRKSCKECGFENEKDAAFCSNCGEKLEMFEEAEEKPAEEDITVAAAETAFNTMENAKEKVVDLSKKAAEKAEEAFEQTEDRAEQVADTVKETAEKVVDKVKDTTEKAADKANDTAKKAAKKVKDTTEKVADKAKEKLEEVKKED